MLAGIVILATAIRAGPVGETIDWPDLAQPPRLDNRLDYLVYIHDGAYAATLASDPLLRRYRDAVDTPEHAAYRAARPAWGYLAWAASLGQQGWVPYALLALTIVSVGFAAWQLAAWFPRALLGAAVILLPGVLGSVRWLLPEALGLGLVLWGVRRRAVLPLALAGLVRETLLLPALWLLVRERRARYLVPFAVYGAWLVVVRARVGEWSFAGTPVGTIEPLGILRTTGGWEDVTIGVICVALLALAWRHPVVAGYGLFALLLGPVVWRQWWDVARVLLPGYGLAIALRAADVDRPGAEAPISP